MSEQEWQDEMNRWETMSDAEKASFVFDYADYLGIPRPTPDAPYVLPVMRSDGNTRIIFSREHWLREKRDWEMLQSKAV